MLEAGFSNISTGKTDQGALLNHGWPDLPPKGLWDTDGSISEDVFQRN